MTNINPNKFIKTEWDKLPKEIRDAISESGWDKTLKEIGEKKKLTSEEVGKLGIEVVLVFLGSTHPLDFVDALRENLGWDREKALEISEEVGAEIMQKILDRAKAKGWKDEVRTFTEKEEKALDELVDIDEEKSLSYEEMLLVERYNIMPKPVQDAFIDLNVKIKELGDKFNLNEKNLSDIENVLTIELLSERDINKISKNLERKLTLGEEAKKSVISFINEKILSPVNEKIKTKTKDFQNKSIIGSDEKISKKFNELPEHLRWAIIDTDVDSKVIKIGKEEQLNVEQIGELVLKTFAVMLGYIKRENFEASLKASLGFPDEKIEKLVNLINNEVLRPIRGKLMNRDIQKEVGDDLNKKESDILQQTKAHIESKEAKKETFSSPIQIQRLSGTFKLPSTTTNHSLTNIGKQTPTPKEPTTSSKIDPYREIPE